MHITGRWQQGCGEAAKVRKGASDQTAWLPCTVLCA